MIHTPNLQLLPIERVHVETLLRSKSELAALLQVTVPDGWPHFPEAFSLAANESHAYSLLEAHWGGYFFLHRKDRVLVGHGAFKGPPDDSGTVEIGYEIRPSRRGQGYGKLILKYGLDRAKAFGLERVLLTCGEDNLGSQN